MNKQKLYIDDVEAIVEELGFKLVDYKLVIQKHSVKCIMDIHNPSGYISHDDCTLVSRRCYDFLFGEFGDVLSMEVSSPGVNRILKTEREFSVFKGYDVELYFKALFLNTHGYKDENGNPIPIANGSVFVLEDFADDYFYLREVFTNENDKSNDVRSVSDVLLKVCRTDISKIKLLN